MDLEREESKESGENDDKIKSKKRCVVATRGGFGFGSGSCTTAADGDGSKPLLVDGDDLPRTQRWDVNSNP